ncbi:Hypothetical Protein XCAW_03282 [Xanthomonas citri subsp. citri Aw12879]|nr:Hypothetical Protein XCAW_03282 [Xanthomonas citri subsp. citri Aw12879]
MNAGIDVTPHRDCRGNMAGRWQHANDMHGLASRNDRRDLQVHRMSGIARCRPDHRNDASADHFADPAGIAVIAKDESLSQPAGHFFATHLDSVAGQGLRTLVHSLVQRPSTGGVEKMRRLACARGLVPRWRMCQARQAGPAQWRCRCRQRAGQSQTRF